MRRSTSLLGFAALVLALACGPALAQTGPGEPECKIPEGCEPEPDPQYGGGGSEEIVCMVPEGCEGQYEGGPEEPTCTRLEGCAEEGQYAEPVAAMPAPEMALGSAVVVEDRNSPPKPPDSEAVAPSALRASDAVDTLAADPEPRVGSVGDTRGDTAALAIPPSAGNGPAGVPVLPATGGSRFSSPREPSRRCSVAYSRGG